MKLLTTAEEQVTIVLWELKSGMLMEIVESMPAPQPHENTVTTILKNCLIKILFLLKILAGSIITTRLFPRMIIV